MYPIQHSETIMMIHDTMVHEEMERNSPRGHRERRGPYATKNPVIAIRLATATALIRIGSWIAPAAGPNIGSILPARKNSAIADVKR